MMSSVATAPQQGVDTLFSVRRQASRSDMAIESRFYDWQRAHGMQPESARGNVDLYDALARDLGGPILEIGCGTGRVATELAERGYEVVGLDANPHALRAAERRLASGRSETGVDLVEGDMRGFDLGRAFSLVVLDGDTFQRLTDARSQRDCLACIARHLSPRGRAVFELSPFDRAADTGDSFEHRVTAFFEDRAAVVAMYERVRQERELELTHFDRRYDVFHPGLEPLTFDTALPLRHVHRREMELLLETVGLGAEELREPWQSERGRAGSSWVRGASEGSMFIVAAPFA
jgi:SAM-dependent methyltransferase